MSNSTPRAALPPLPEPFDYCYEWDGPYGKRKIGVAAPHNGRGPSRTHLLFTAEQLQADRLMVAEHVIRACAELCAAEQAENRALAKGSTTAMYDWMADGAGLCRGAILALLPVKEPKE